MVESFQSVETTKQGIFVMPKERITIASTYIAPAEGQDAPTCDAKLKELTARFQHQAAELNAVRQKCLPGWPGPRRGGAPGEERRARGERVR